MPELTEKWNEILENGPEFANETQKHQTSIVLENISNELQEAGTQTPDIAKWDPVLISMVRRTMPTLIANDLMGVQPMTGPTGLIFAMHSWYGDDPAASGANEAFTQDEPNKDHSGPYDTNTGENLGVGLEADTTSSPADVTQINPWPEMSFSVSKQSVTAEERKLKARFTNELAQDLKAIHGLDAESELSNILTSEVAAEINREMIATIFNQAKPGAQNASTPGTYDMSNDADGRWAVEKYKTLIKQIGAEAQIIAQQTRRGVGNWVVTSANVANALDMTGMIDTSFNPGSFNVDPVGVTYAGMLAGKFRLYIDPYMTTDTVTVGYKGSNPYDAGYFYCPYVPMQFYRATDSESFQPAIGVSTRYGMTNNPFETGNANENKYYRKFAVTNL